VRVYVRACDPACSRLYVTTKQTIDERLQTACAWRKGDTHVRAYVCKSGALEDCLVRARAPSNVQRRLVGIISGIARLFVLIHVCVMAGWRLLDGAPSTLMRELRVLSRTVAIM
jgi:hypothetical protein